MNGRVGMSSGCQSLFCYYLIKFGWFVGGKREELGFERAKDCGGVMFE